MRSKSSVSIIVVVLSLFAAVLGCQGDVDTSRLGRDTDGDIDVTSFDGLEVHGRLQVGNTDAVDGPLNLIALQLSLLTECYDELVRPSDSEGNPQAFLGNPVSDVCRLSSSEEVNFQEEDTCQQNLCAQQIFLCLGLKNQELAETTQPVEVTTNPFLPSPMCLSTPDSCISPDGSYEMLLNWVWITAGA
jgi:hypothetical protein